MANGRLVLEMISDFKLVSKCGREELRRYVNYFLHYHSVPDSKVVIKAKLIQKILQIQMLMPCPRL